LQANYDSESENVATMRRAFEETLRFMEPNVVVFGSQELRQKNVSCFAIPQLQAESTLMALDLDGICVSSGAACSSGKVSPSHVLEAMGIDESLARCALRVSFGPELGLAEMEILFNSLRNLMGRKLALAAAAGGG
jgi:cysteine desulfurase